MKLGVRLVQMERAEAMIWQAAYSWRMRAGLVGVGGKAAADDLSGNVGSRMLRLDWMRWALIRGMWVRGKRRRCCRRMLYVYLGCVKLLLIVMLECGTVSAMQMLKRVIMADSKEIKGDCGLRWKERVGLGSVVREVVNQEIAASIEL